MVIPWLAGAIGSCGGSKSPPSVGGAILEVTVTTDLAIPKDLDVINVQVIDDRTSLLNEVRVLGPKGVSLPSTFRVIQTGTSNGVRVMVNAKGLLPKW